MKLTLIVAFVVFVVSLAISVVVGLQMIWQDPSQPPSTWSLRFLGTSIVVMVAAIFYVSVGDAMIRIRSAVGKSPPDGKC